MKNLYILLSCISVLFACHPDGKKPVDLTPNPFRWLSGNWQMQTDSMVTSETWNETSPEQMDGFAYAFMGKDTVFREVLRVTQIGGHWIYIAQVEQSQPVSFAAKRGADPENICFENTEHDFPQRVIYKRNGEHSCTAIVEGGEQGQLHKEAFVYEKTVKE